MSSDREPLMYLEHYGLSEPPFRITPHTDFFFSGANRGATLEALLYAITHDEGIVKISGEVGSGKTMLCRVLMERLPENVVIIYLANPSLSREDILYALADELGIVVEEHARANTVMRSLQQKLLALYAESKQVVVLIDEAHAMPKETLEEIRLLSNLESNRHKLLQLVLFGQPELNETLGRADMRQLRERITQSFSLEPLVRDDIAEYLDFRMRAAGYRGPSVFTADAIKLIDKASLGLTRRINILADKSLLASYAAGTHQVGAKEAREAIRDAEFADTSSVQSRRPSPPLVWALAGALLMLGLVGLWQSLQQPEKDSNTAQTFPTAPIAVAPPPASQAPITMPPPLPPLQVAPVQEPARIEPPPPVPEEKKRSSTPMLDKYLESSQNWLETVAATRWFVQIFTSIGDDRPEQVEWVLAKAIDAKVDKNQLRVYHSEISGISRYGVIYGDYASRKDAVNALNTLPPELKRHRPYPRQAVRLKPNSNTPRVD